MWCYVVIIAFIILMVVGVLLEGNRNDEPGHSPWG